MMFKQLLENKISSKLNNFNFAGQIATDLIDKFRNTIDTTVNGLNGTNSNEYEFNVNINQSASVSSMSEPQVMQSQPSQQQNPPPKPQLPTPQSTPVARKVNQENNHVLAKKQEIKTQVSFDSDTNDKKLSRQESSDGESDSSSVYNHKRSLSTRSYNRELLDSLQKCQFPLKPFQKVNSKTVEIPGLNVKVVQYTIKDDLGKIEPKMYIKFNTGCAEALNTPSKGKLFFSLFYNNDIKSLSVTITKAEIDMQATKLSTLPDTYVKVQLLPDKKRKYQTKIQRKSCSPVYEETFYFQLNFEDLASRTLCLTLLDFGRFSKHSIIGSVRINDFSTIKDLSTKEVELSRNILNLQEDDFELGELTLTLCYLPAAGRLTVTIDKASNLKAMDINGKSDPYVKVTLVSRGKRVKKKKTSVIRNELNPIFNESMIFDVPQEQIDFVDMVVKVIDYDRVGSNELIGCIGIGPSFDGLGKDHYFRMLENPRKPQTQTYFLRDASFLRDGLPPRVKRALKTSRQTSVDSRNDN